MFELLRYQNDVRMIMNDIRLHPSFRFSYVQETVAGHPSAGLGWHGSCMVLPWPCPAGSSRAGRVDPGLWSAFGGRGAGLLDAAGLSLRIYQSINPSTNININQSNQYQSIKSIKSIKSIIGLVYRNILTRQPLVVNVKNHCELRNTQHGFAPIFSLLVALWAQLFVGNKGALGIQRLWLRWRAPCHSKRALPAFELCCTSCGGCNWCFSPATPTTMISGEDFPLNQSNVPHVPRMAAWHSHATLLCVWSIAKKTPEIFGLKHHFPHILMAMLNHVENIGMFPIVIIGQS